MFPIFFLSANRIVQAEIANVIKSWIELRLLLSSRACLLYVSLTVSGPTQLQSLDAPPPKIPRTPLIIWRIAPSYLPHGDRID